MAHMTDYQILMNKIEQFYQNHGWRFGFMHTQRHSYESLEVHFIRLRKGWWPWKIGRQTCECPVCSGVGFISQLQQGSFFTLEGVDG